MVNAANEQLAKDLLDLMLKDSENLERTLSFLTDDCVWVMEPGGTEYQGFEELKTYIGIAMSARTHDSGPHKIEILNWFSDDQNICVEYTHGMVSTGKLTSGFKGTIKTGTLRYCITYHIRDGKFDRVHEYINSTSLVMNSLMPILLWYLHRRTMKKLVKAKRH